ncbi:MFS transporter, MCP family, solute carrier family 16 (monocarboxylic acid transporters), member 14 [Strigomonas culicis]|uniref:MFS transporter, MCP family, solute carrier family 16 (Monocarboxylic acid transporters), member 14 n=1 Tax=Strigomonas culicis TaxID=28005 RepID=S9VLA7_9TRYP|nr:MFS transporter, MCP family, solute carrier family 16 (monocarboxylic acid transporters), member 14 [Strigomonas culicis]|eukprot:EPY24010.1 MFS transporter, MCP family, solute carrier family 16 (monocarboxylic acid transporters), member 14 [Strigomonas culicis]
MMLISTALLFLGCWLASSFAKSAVEVTFSYCLLASISSAFMLSPGAAATGSWFQRALGLAQGITFSGGGIGSAWISPILGTWVEAYGWRKTFRLMSCFCAIGLFASIFSCRRHNPDEASDDEAAAAGDAEADSLSGSNEKLATPKEGLPEDKANSTAPEDSGNATIEGVYKGFFTPEAELLAILKVRRLRPAEYARAVLTRAFLANFFMFAIYGWAFYSLIYMTVPYVSSMGSAGTAYAGVMPISTSKASSVYTFWGAFQIIGSVLVGGLASFTADEFAYCACCVVGAVSTALLSVCRNYASFAATYSIVGFCSAGVFAVMPALIARSFYGPNLGFFMGGVFVAGCLGGFSAPPIQAQLAAHYNGNYTYGCVFTSVCFTAPGILCYTLLWQNKQNAIARWWRRRTQAAAPQARGADSSAEPFADPKH